MNDWPPKPPPPPPARAPIRFTEIERETDDPLPIPTPPPPQPGFKERTKQALNAAVATPARKAVTAGVSGVLLFAAGVFEGKYAFVGGILRGIAGMLGGSPE